MRTTATSDYLVKILVDTCTKLSNRRQGAIIVLTGRNSVDRFTNGGFDLNGTLSDPLLLSLFDPTSEGHDGAVVLNGSQVTRFAVHLPLSSSFEQLGSRGTRHAQHWDSPSNATLFALSFPKRVAVSRVLETGCCVILAALRNLHRLWRHSGLAWPLSSRSSQCFP